MGSNFEVLLCFFWAFVLFGGDHWYDCSKNVPRMLGASSYGTEHQGWHGVGREDDNI